MKHRARRMLLKLRTRYGFNLAISERINNGLLIVRVTVFKRCALLCACKLLQLAGVCITVGAVPAVHVGGMENLDALLVVSSGVSVYGLGRVGKVWVIRRENG